METIFVANWKLHKTISETEDFFRVFQEKLSQTILTDKKIVICPSYLSIPKASQLKQEHSLPLFIGAQDVSVFENGAYTGEVGAFQLKELGEYVIIGHSERRRNFHETPEGVQKKVDQAKKVGLQTIVCVQDEQEPVPLGADIVAFEPVNAIGTGDPEDPARIQEVFHTIRERHADLPLLYGGSVTPETIAGFKTVSHLSGFLVGGASLDPDSFFSLIQSW